MDLLYVHGIDFYAKHGSAMYVYYRRKDEKVKKREKKLLFFGPLTYISFMLFFLICFMLIFFRQHSLPRFWGHFRYHSTLMLHLARRLIV